MGEFRFRLPDNWTLDTRQAGSIHVVGLDGVPWPCKVQVDQGTLVIRRLRDESGKTYVAYPFQTRGELVICTGTLPEHDDAYDFMTELARGTVNRLRNQISIWQEGGLHIDQAIHDLTRNAIGKLGHAILHSDPSARDRLASETLELAIEAIFDLAHIFGQQISSFRCEHDEFATFWLAGVYHKNGQANHEPSLLNGMFELLEIAPTGSPGQILPDLTGEFAQRKTIVGPLLDASAGGMQQPFVDASSFDERKSMILDQCKTVLSEIPPTSAMIHVACGINGMGHRHLSYPQQLQTVIDLLQTIEESPVDVPTMISFDFPWAERLASSVGGVHPLQIADTLLRQGLTVSFLGLDLNLDYWPGGSVLRDPLQWIDLIDVWSQLGLPLVICMRIPSAVTNRMPDPETGKKNRLINEIRSNQTDQQRMELASVVLPMLVARPSVHGIIWRQMSDDDDYRYPSGGLLNNQAKSKPATEMLANFRKNVLGR